MKKIYALILCGFIACNLLAGTTINNPTGKHLSEPKHARRATNKTNDVIYEQIGYRGNHYISGSWQGVDSTTTQHDAAGNDTVNIIYTYNGNTSTWVRYSKTTQTYNAQSGLTASLEQNWDTVANQWVNYRQTLHTLDANQNSTLDLIQQWLQGTSQWVNNIRIANVYNSANNPISSLEQTWDNVGQAWKNNTRGTATFDSTGKYELSTTQESYFTGAWVFFAKTIYTRNSHHTLIGDTSQHWNAATSLWVNDDCDGTIYDSLRNRIADTHDVYDTVAMAWVHDTKNVYSNNTYGYPTQEMDSTWSTAAGVFKPTLKVVNIYDNNNALTSSEQLNWDATSGTFKPANRNSFNYDANFNNTYRRTEIYNSTTVAYENSNEYYYYYQAFTVSGVAETESVKNVNIYPNPTTASNGIFASFSLVKDSYITINIYDNDGKLVLTQSGNYGAGDNNTKLNIGHLANGMYHVQYVNATDNSAATLNVMVQ